MMTELLFNEIVLNPLPKKTEVEEKVEEPEESGEPEIPKKKNRGLKTGYLAPQSIFFFKNRRVKTGYFADFFSFPKK